MPSVLPGQMIGYNLEVSSTEATIQVAPVFTGSPDRDAHLRSGDFFDVESFPTIRFVSTSVEADGDDYVLRGDLTIRDTTKPVVVPVVFEGTATDPFGNKRAGFSAELEVDREDWGLTWNAALETGGGLVSKRVTLVLDVSVVASA